MEGTVEHRGCRIAYGLRGSGPGVLFVQGVGVHGAGWGPQIDHLATRYSCLTFDHRGVGASTPAGSLESVEQMGEDARAVLGAAGWQSAHVVGHSLGGLIALWLALNDPGRVRSLSLLCTFARGRDAAPLTARMAVLGIGTRLGTASMRRRAFLRLVLPRGSPAAGPEFLARLTELFGHDLASQPAIVGAQLRALRRCDFSDRLHELAGIPTLIVSAQDDLIAPVRAGKVLAAKVPGSWFVVQPRAAHGLPITHADLVNPLIETHLGGGRRLGVASPPTLTGHP